MKNKKLMSLALALAMVLALTVPALATVNVGTGSTQSGGAVTTTLTGEFKNYDLDLTIGNASKVLVNPYKISFTPAGKDDPVSDQIVNVGTFITNSTNVALKVSAKITPVLSGNVSLLDSASEVNTKSASIISGGTVQSDGTISGGTVLDTYVPKGAFMVFQILSCADTETEPTWTKPTDVVDGTTEGAKILTGDGTTAIDFADCLTLNAVGADDDPNYACFHLDGLLNVYPSKNVNNEVVEDKWTTADTIGASVILTFEPKVDLT